MFLVHTIGISSKLDFGSDNDEPKTIIIKGDGSSQYKVIKEETKTNFDDIGVICVSGDCKKTDTNPSVVSTDVVVHVRNNVNVSGINNTKEEETPDVPVVAGYGTSGVHSIVNNDVNLHHPPSTYPSTYNYNTPEFIPLQPEIITIPSRNYRRNRPIYHSKTDPRNYKNVGFQTNNVEIQVPHRPYYANHYFGEHPPPQLVWYTNGRSTYNPLEFKRTQPEASNAFFWNNVRSLTTNQPHPVGTTCTCTDGSTYYPTTHPQHVHKRTTDIQVDDKLSLN